MADTLAARLRAGKTLLTAWSAIPDALVAEACARAGFDAVTLDMQHGFHGVDSVLRGIGAARLGGVDVATSMRRCAGTAGTGWPPSGGRRCGRTWCRACAPPIEPGAGS